MTTGKLYDYFLFTAKGCPLHIALKWFYHFKKKNMAAVLTRKYMGKFSDFDVWVECDPEMYGDYEVEAKMRRKKLEGEILLSCGNLRERYNDKLGTFSKREDYIKARTCSYCGSHKLTYTKKGCSYFCRCDSCGFKEGYLPSSKETQQANRMEYAGVLKKNGGKFYHGLPFDA